MAGIQPTRFLWSHLCRKNRKSLVEYLDSRASSLLLGEPFPNISFVSQCSSDQVAQCSVTTGPFVTEVKLLGNADTPALDLVLKDGGADFARSQQPPAILGTLIPHPSRPGLRRDRARLARGYKRPARHSTTPELHMTSGIDLSIGASGSFKIQNINFSRQPNGHTNLTATGGIISASLGTTARLLLPMETCSFLMTAHRLT